MCADKKKSSPRSDKEKTELFGYVCRMSNSRKIKLLVFAIVEGKNEVEIRLHIVHDIEDWCIASPQELS